MNQLSARTRLNRAVGGFAVLEFIIALTVAATIGGASYYVYETRQDFQYELQARNSKNDSQPKKPDKIDKSKLTSWERYNSGKKLRFVYPDNWHIREDELWIELYSPDYKESASVYRAEALDGAHVSIGFFRNNLFLNNKRVDTLKKLRVYIDDYGGNYAKTKSSDTKVAGYKGLSYKCGHYRQADCATAIVGHNLLEIRRDIVNNKRKKSADRIVESIVLNKK